MHNYWFNVCIIHITVCNSKIHTWNDTSMSKLYFSFEQWNEQHCLFLQRKSVRISPQFQKVTETNALTSQVIRIAKYKNKHLAAFLAFP